MTAAGPRVLVLLATFQGRPFLAEQLDSLLAQREVRVQVLARDDGSTDGTAAELAERAAADRRIRLLTADPAPVDPAAADPATITAAVADHSAGGAAGNFYRLLRAVDDDVLAGVDAVALADQDDIWAPDKLARQWDDLVTGGFDGVSSNVTAFSDDPAGRSDWLLRKDYPQRAFDFLLESPGPGCSFLLTPRLVRLVRAALADPAGPAAAMEFHDWLIYGVCRAAGWRWLIESRPTLRYRQHAGNTFGANAGWQPKLRRIALIRRHWHRGQAALMCTVAESVAAIAGESAGGTAGGTAPPAQRLADLRRMHRLIDGRGMLDRLRLAARAGSLRRRPLHRIVVGALIATGIW